MKFITQDYFFMLIYCQSGNVTKLFHSLIIRRVRGQKFK